MITNLNSSNFQDAIQSSKPILVDFWATWCGPCTLQGHILHDISNDFPDLQIGKVNVDECGQLAASFGIEAIPTMILFKDGQAVEKIVGLRQADDLLALFEKHGAEV